MCKIFLTDRILMEKLPCAFNSAHERNTNSSIRSFRPFHNVNIPVLITRNWSRESGLNRRPRPSLTPSLHMPHGEGLDCIFPPVADPCQSFGPSKGVPRSWPAGLLTVIRDSLICYQKSGRGLRPTMDVLYQLSYLGLTHGPILAEFL